MPSRREHLAQARANRAYGQRLLLASPNDPTALQWAVTVAFYCAVHSIEAHLARYSFHSRTHRLRETYMADPRVGIPADVYAAYRALRQRSEGARYLMWRFTATQVREEIFGGYLVTVAAFSKL